MLTTAMIFMRADNTAAIMYGVTIAIAEPRFFHRGSARTRLGLSLEILDAWFPFSSETHADAQAESPGRP